MRTWCNDAITGVKQERGGTQTGREKKVSQVVLFLTQGELPTIVCLLGWNPHILSNPN